MIYTYHAFGMIYTYHKGLIRNDLHISQGFHIPMDRRVSEATTLVTRHGACSSVLRAALDGDLSTEEERGFHHHGMSSSSASLSLSFTASNASTPCPCPVPSSRGFAPFCPAWAERGFHHHGRSSSCALVLASPSVSAFTSCTSAASRTPPEFLLPPAGYGASPVL